MDPIVTTRISNPRFDPITKVYSVDAEFKCDVSGQKLYGMNVRFFYRKADMAFKSFSNQAPGYAALGTPRMSTCDPPGDAFMSPARLGFNDPIHYINGTLYARYKSLIPVVPVDGWVKLFQINFTANPPSNFCPSIIWDKRYSITTELGGMIGYQNPTTDLIKSSSSGICITLIEPTEPDLVRTISTKEFAEQLNWQYNTEPGLPYGFPTPNNCINI